MPNLEGIAFKVIITKNPEYDLAFKTILLGASASQMAYNNSSSGLEATSVQNAIDELASDLEAKADASSVYTKEETDIEISALIDDAHVANNKTWSSEKISKEIYDILPTEEASGELANFNTSLVLPLIDVKAEIKAVETGTGAKSPSNPYTIGGFSNAVITRAGKNLLSEVERDDTNTNNIYFWKTSGYVLPAGTYTLSLSEQVSGLYILDFDTNTNLFVKYNSDFITFTLTETKKVYFGVYKIDIDHNDKFQLELGSTATTYEPYTGTQITIALGQTVYGGEIDCLTGMLKITHAIIKFSDLTWGSSTWGSGTAYSATVSDAKLNSTSTLAGLVCEMYNEVTAGSMYSSNNDAICLNTNILRIRDNNFATFNEWRQATADCEVVYPLATPIEVDITPQAIMPFLGVNNFFNDTNGDTTVKYKLSIEEYVAKKIAEITDDNMSLNASLLRGSGDEREDIALPLSDELEREAIREPERDDSQR